MLFTNLVVFKLLILFQYFSMNFQYLRIFSFIFVLFNCKYVYFCSQLQNRVFMPFEEFFFSVCLIYSLMFQLTRRFEHLIEDTITNGPIENQNRLVLEVGLISVFFNHSVCFVHGTSMQKIVTNTKKNNYTII